MRTHHAGSGDGANASRTGEVLIADEGRITGNRFKPLLGLRCPSEKVAAMHKRGRHALACRARMSGINFDANRVFVAHNELPITARGIQQAIGSASNDPTH